MKSINIHPYEVIFKFLSVTRHFNYSKMKLIKNLINKEIS